MLLTGFTGDDLDWSLEILRYNMGQFHDCWLDSFADMVSRVVVVEDTS